MSESLDTFLSPSGERSPVQGAEPVFPVEFQGNQDPGQAIDRLEYARCLTLVNEFLQIELVDVPGRLGGPTAMEA